MTTPSEPGPSQFSNGVLCDRCRESVRGLKEDITDLPWTDAAQQLVSTQLARPQYWPIGYIFNNSYSPFNLEHEMPKHHWRDAFEDLLAVESGRGLISLEDRRRETEATDQLRFERTSNIITRLNHLLRKDAADLALLEKTRDVAKTRNDELVVSFCDEKAGTVNELMKMHIQLAEVTRDGFKAYNGITGSQSKGLGHWAASLITNGAMKGWWAAVSNSEGGELWHFEKHRHKEGEDIIGSTSTEGELHGLFVNKIPLSTEGPGPALDERPSGRLTANGSFPLDHDAINEGNPFPRQYNDDGESEDSEGLVERLGRVELSRTPEYLTTLTLPAVRYQSMEANNIKNFDGSIGTRVILRTWFMDGTSGKSEFTNDSTKVLQEVFKARHSIHDRNAGW